ncbi:hypothetical protein CFC21_093522 [Triticum aestivum]|uniref:RING-type domain-containing protein n=4 Tax=Triticinae TaxID=1648030 RepID=A0A9R1LL17_WHEAT|nr:E3 ubiquitin-protein ligase ATL23 [Aegilops tauschii subsp. strangulata]XP_044416757.1 E3 ubiquitin-protein ligase ATL23-like [Triticum aestivum]KAF7090829.1 hypothetical protein CFC21_093522 [Triticum aestivum]
MARMAVSVLFLIAGVVLMLALHVLVIVWAVRRGAVLRLRGAARERDQEQAEAAGLTADELGELPCQDFKAAAAVGTGAGECAVCLEAFQGGDRCRVLPGCHHGFHAQCVDSWLRQSRRCPVCRAEVACRGKAADAVVDETATSEIVAERLGGADR